MQTIPKKQLVWGIIICSVAALFYCYEYLLRIIPGAIQPQLRHAFGGITATAFGNLTAYYYYAYTPMQLPVGMLMDRYGPRRLLLIACLACALGSFLFTLTAFFKIAAFGRFLVGFGSAFAFVGVLSLTHSWLPRQYFSLVAGLVTTLGMLGAILGEVGIAVLVNTIGWKQLLYYIAWAGVAITVLIYFLIQDAPDNKKSKHVVNKHFMENVLAVLTSTQVWLIGTVGALLYMSLSVFAEVWGKNYLMVVHRLSSYEAATAVSMVFLGWAIGAPFAGFISDWTGKRILPLVVGAFFAAICITIVLYMPGLPIMVIKLLLLLYGIFSSAEIIIFIMGKENSEANLAATAFAVVNMIVMLGGAILQPMVGYLLDLVWSGDMAHQMRVYSASEYQLVLSLLPLGLMIVMILGFFLKENPPTKATN